MSSIHVALTAAPSLYLTAYVWCAAPTSVLSCRGATLCRAFNCVQRAHQNTLEQLPIWFAAQAALASVHPMTAGVLGFVWMTGMCYAEVHAYISIVAAGHAL